MKEDSPQDVTKRADSALTRREFAALGGLTLLAGILPIGCAETKGRGTLLNPRDVTADAIGGPATHPAAGELVSEATEQLANGAIRTTHVISWRSLPPLGAETTQTLVKTVTPTAAGEVVEVDISFAPRLVVAAKTEDAGRIVGRYEYTHGPVRGDMREDTVEISGTIDGKPVPHMKKRVLRPVSPQGEFAGLSSGEQLRRAIELLNRQGHLKGIPGTMIELPPV